MNQLRLIPREATGKVVNQRASDGYIDATAMCNAAGKKLSHYVSNKQTGEFLQELSSDAGIPVSGLVQIIKGGSPQNQGTWVHPQVATHLAQWLSPKFAVMVSKWVTEWLNVGTHPNHMPHHLQRYLVNRRKIPATHFSMLNEITMALVAPLEDMGYILPDNMVPDISEGIVFSKWLKDNKGVDPKSFPTYMHEYPDGRKFPARLYPMEYYVDFKVHFAEVWLPNYAPKYFKKRDAKVLQLLESCLLPDLS